MGLAIWYGADADLCHISVEECIKMCGLEAYADAIVGTLGCEQLKRTTVGVELVAKVGLCIVYICLCTHGVHYSRR